MYRKPQNFNSKEDIVNALKDTMIVSEDEDEKGIKYIRETKSLLISENAHRNEVAVVKEEPPSLTELSEEELFATLRKQRNER